MDKAQEAIRHEVSRPIKQIASNGGGDVIDISHRSTKDKARGSRLIAQLNSSPESIEMGGGNKRYKLHSKSFKNCNGVHHAVVPRKLRSAMDKHNHDFPSPPLTKKHHLTSNGIEHHQYNNAKKSKKIAQAILDSITKDEEEVVETLFALARMSPNKKTTRSGLDEQIPAEMCSPSMENNQNSLLNSEALEEEIVKSQHSCPTIEPINVSSSFEGTAGEVVKANSFIGPTALCRPTILENNEFELCLGSSSALSDCERSSLRCRSEHTDNPTLSIAASSSQFAWHEASVCKQYPDGGLVPITATLRRQEKQQPIMDGESCLAYAEGLWPSLPIMWSCGSEIHGDSSRSSLTKSPAFLTSTSTATRTGSVATLLFEEQPQQGKVDRGNSWKRCAAHVYISQLIKSYQATEKKSRWPIPSNQVNPNERTKLIATTNGSTGQKQSVNVVISMGSTSSLNAAALMAGTNGSAIPKYSNEVANGHIQEKMIQPKQQLFSTPSMMNTKEKQNCNFLSLLAGGVVRPLAANSDSDNQRETEFESLSQIRVPYLQSISQHNQLMPFALPHGHYPSSQQVQLAQYFGNPSYIPQVPSHASSVPQQQQQIWTAQYSPGPGGIGMSWNHSPKWQSGGLDSTSLLPCTQPILSSSSPSEVFGAKFSPAMEQQQILAFSSSSSKGKAMHYPLPGSCNGSGIKFYQEVSPHWQLLCNGERL